MGNRMRCSVFKAGGGRVNPRSFPSAPPVPGSRQRCTISAPAAARISTTTSHQNRGFWTSSAQLVISEVNISGRKDMAVCMGNDEANIPESCACPQNSSPIGRHVASAIALSTTARCREATGPRGRAGDASDLAVDLGALLHELHRLLSPCPSPAPRARPTPCFAA